MDTSTRILSDIISYMKYARYVPELNRRETWDETVTRNMEMHIKRYPQLEERIRENYKLVYERKVLPSMRSMQFAGKSIEISPSRIYNCSYLPIDDHRAFSEIMHLLLSGVGCGFSVQKHHVEQLPEIRKPNVNRKKRFLIGDSIEGWADAIKTLMKSYFNINGTSTIIFDYSDIRPKGARLVTSGGKAPGPQPLKDCIYNITKILEQKNDGEKLTPLEAHDIICFIADAVLSGGIRRAALISFFSLSDDDMISCKSGNWWETNPQRGRANNSVVILRHRIEEKAFMELWERIKSSGCGEPGIMFTNDKEILGNPCNEVSLKPFQFCNLCEINASDIENQKDFNERVAAATFIGTLQASYTNFHYLRDIWQKTTEKDALLGVGMTGLGSGKFYDIDLEEGVAIAKRINKELAKEIGINKASRITVIKPSGTSSLVLGTSSGIHAWHNDYYIRRVRVGKNEPIYQYLAINHPELVEDEYFKPHLDAVISIPQKAPKNSILRHESALNLLNRIKYVTKHWIIPGHIKGENHNNVSATVSIKEDEWDVVGRWMWDNRDFYNGLSVLPFDGHTYKQAPFEDCSKETYEEMMKYLTEIDLSKIIEMDDNTDLRGEAACAGGLCTITSI